MSNIAPKGGTLNVLGALDVSDKGQTRENLEVLSEAATLPLVTARAVAPGLIFASGNNRMANIRLGDSAKVGLSDFTVLWQQHIPEDGSYPGRGFLTFSDSPSSYTSSSFNGSNCPLFVLNPGGNVLRLYGGGLTQFSDSYALADKHGLCNFALTRGVADGLLRLYVDGLKVIEWAGSGNFDAAGEIADDYLRFGSETSSQTGGRGRVQGHVLLNRTLSDAEILAHAQTGLLPDGDMVTPASTVRIANGTFTSGGARPMDVITGTSDGGATVEKTQTSLDARFGTVLPASWGIAGGSYLISFDLTKNSGQLPELAFQDGTGTDTAKGATIISAGSMVVGQNLKVITPSANDVADRRISFYWDPSDTFDGAVSDFKITPIGRVAAPKIQPGAVVHPDDTGNGNHMLITTDGVTAVGDKPDTIVVPGYDMTADGFVLANQVITPSGYELVAAYVEQTGTETSTITVTETSSGGTTVATGALSASTTRVALTVSNGLLAGGKKLHLANSSWASNTVTPFFVFRRAS